MLDRPEFSESCWFTTPDRQRVGVTTRGKRLVIGLVLFAAVALLGVAGWLWQDLTDQRQASYTQTPVLVVPAVVSATYVYRRSAGPLAVLESERGLRLEFPEAWLPEGVQTGDELRVTTRVELGGPQTTFLVTIKMAN